MNKNKIQSILVFLCGEVGDMLVSVPALAALRQAFSSAKITLLTSETGRIILQGCCHVDEFILYQKNIPKLLSLLKWIKKQKFDLFINLHMDPYRTTPYMLWRDSFILSTLTGISQSIQYPLKSSLFSPLADSKSNPLKNPRHMAEYMLEIISQVIDDGKPTRMQLWLTEEEQEYAHLFLKNQNVLESDFLIAIHPGAKRWFHRWPVENYAQLMDFLVEQFHAKLIVTGNQEEMRLVENIRQQTKYSFISIAGKTNLRQLAALLSKCKLLICNNTGPLHLSVALGVPTISFTGPASSVLWGPYQDKEKHQIIYKPYPCSPCEKDNCFMGQPYCLHQISVEDVIRETKPFLEKLSKFSEI